VPEVKLVRAASLVYWKKSSRDDFFDTALPIAAAKSVVFAACVSA
jgi:hypothetical protein